MILYGTCLSVMDGQNIALDHIILKKIAKNKKSLKKLKDNLDAAENDFADELKYLPIRLYYQDEARFGRINTVQKCWCIKGIIPSLNNS